ncbi:MAG TPA: flagellar basal body L-ring protein FlgH, partial [Aquificales bacterium]|nr:flagellar basal body L-ring protein FlgH [Aquificales bacterium]
KGDIVYIIVYESIDAVQKLATQTGQQHQIANAINSFFGIHPKTLQNLGVDWQYKSSSKYSGSTQQSGVLSTRLAAYVKKVYPNGNLLIEASRYIYLNEAGHKIILRGIVRPEDIGPDNSIPSSRIANLEIIYDGKGYMVDASSPGWFTRFLAKLWPF